VAPEERDAIRVQVDRVATAYEKNTISWEQFADIATEFQGSPLLDTIMLMAVEEQYLKPSQLNDEEKDLGLKVLKRVARGAMEHQIDRDEIAQLLDQISFTGGNNRRLKPTLSDEELRRFLTECEELAESHDVPEGDYNFRPSRELKRILDKVLGPTPDLDRDSDDKIDDDMIELGPESPKPLAPDEKKPDEKKPDEKTSEEKKPDEPAADNKAVDPDNTNPDNKNSNPPNSEK
jgi:hypothetical protein